MKARYVNGWLIFVSLVLVFCGILGVRFVSERASSEVEELSDAIVSVSNPGIGSLASLRASVFEIQLRLSRALQDPEPEEALRDEVGLALRELNEDVRGYLALPLIPGEERHREQIHRTHILFHDEVIRTVELVAIGRHAEAERLFREKVQPTAGAFITAAMDAIGVHAAFSSELAIRIQEARRRTLMLSNVLTGLYVVLGLLGALLIHREAGRRHDLANARADYHAARAAELEQFAGRVAHDIRNPLTSARLSAELLERRAGDAHVRELAARVVRSLSRADIITSGLLDFARAGARPEPGARTDVRQILDEALAAAASDAERANIELVRERAPPVLIACSNGVYLSLVGNLIGNAIKYMGDARTRRITVRVTDEGQWVRTEVEDTGPGIDNGLLPSLFEPYFRATADARKEGLGLGLATVKKLAEAHGGAVGVRSEPGRGSTFWFTMPKAGSAASVSSPVPPAPRAAQR